MNFFTAALSLFSLSEFFLLAIIIMWMSLKLIFVPDRDLMQIFKRAYLFASLLQAIVYSLAVKSSCVGRAYCCSIFCAKFLRYDYGFLRKLQLSRIMGRPRLVALT